MRPMAAPTLLDSAFHARLAVDVASDGQASDIVMLDITGVSDFADFFVSDFIDRYSVISEFSQAFRFSRQQP